MILKYTRLLSLSVLLLLTHVGFAQYWYWARNIGGERSDKAIIVKNDTAGNVIVAGYFSDHVDLGSGVELNALTAGTSKEAYVAKFDETGTCLWGFVCGGYFDDRVLGMDVDLEGNIYITGTFWSSITIGPYTVYDLAGMSCCDQCFIAKLDPNGVVQWANWAGGMSDDQGLDLTCDANGNTYIAGFMSSNILYLGNAGLTVGALNTGLHVYNYWLGKIDTKGNWLWGKSFGNLPWDPTTFKYIERDIAVCLDDKGYVYLAGGYDGSRYFDTAVSPITGTGTILNSIGGYDLFLMKTDTNGNFYYAKSGGSRKDDWANGIAADSMGHVYVVGEHRDSLWFDTTLVRNYNKRDVLALKFDAETGNSIWGKRAGSDTGSERGNDVYANRWCKVFVCGDVGPKSKFGKFTTDSTQMLQTFVARMDPKDGDWMWVATGGSPDSNDRCNSISKGKSNTIYIAGNYKPTAHYGANDFIAEGKTDGYVAQLKDYTFIDSCEVDQPEDTSTSLLETIQAEGIAIYPNPFTNGIYIQTDYSIDVRLYDMHGREVLRTNDKLLLTTELAPGSYILKVITPIQTTFEKLLKQ